MQKLNIDKSKSIWYVKGEERLLVYAKLWGTFG